MRFLKLQRIDRRIFCVVIVFTLYFYCLMENLSIMIFCFSISTYAKVKKFKLLVYNFFLVVKVLMKTTVTL